MKVIVLKNDVRVAQYHFKRTDGRKHARGIMRFYKALYAGTKQKVKFIILGA